MAGRLIETRSIDYVPLAERHGKVWHLWPVWFSGDAHLATLAVGILGITLGGNLLWTSIAVIAGCALGTFFMAFHSTQGPQLGLPQMIQSRAQFGYRGVLLPLVGTLFTFVGFNVVDVVIIKSGLQSIFGWNPVVVAVLITVIAALTPMRSASASNAWSWTTATPPPNGFCTRPVRCCTTCHSS